MNKLLHLIIVLAIAGIASCTKEKSPDIVTPNPRPPYPMVKQQIDENGDTTNYIYDSFWNLKTINNSGYSLDYSYKADGVYVNDGLSYILNDEGLYYYVATGGMVTTYFYNADSTLSIDDWPVENAKTYYSYQNGNVILAHTRDIPIGGNKTVEDFDEYKYTTNVLNTIGHKNFGKKFMGKSSVNLPDSIIRYSTNNVGDTFTYIYTYSYTFNDSGWVQTKTENDLTNLTEKKYKYFYY